ncbi:hypothetical protein [Francisella sp. SYW-9]|uniref:hypothetical protein n=1 Tax=Francisella sp. SYW-9 TaxID=2610888 RepID=UPI00123DF53B|nr:hypothetical protein [Francisella sp. SYW-9]
MNVDKIEIELDKIQNALQNQNDDIVKIKTGISVSLRWLIVLNIIIGLILTGSGILISYESNRPSLRVLKNQVNENTTELHSFRNTGDRI